MNINNDYIVKRRRELGYALKMRRNEKNLTQEEVAESINCKIRTLAKMEAGDFLRLETLLMLCEILDCQVCLRDSSTSNCLEMKV